MAKNMELSWSDEALLEDAAMEEYLDRHCPGWRDEIVAAEELTSEELAWAGLVKLEA